LLRDGDGKLRAEATTPVRMDNELGLPAGRVFHRDLSWPYAVDPAGGDETTYERSCCAARSRFRCALLW
jgi:hypothetical protein